LFSRCGEQLAQRLGKCGLVSHLAVRPAPPQRLGCGSAAAAGAVAAHWTDGEVTDQTALTEALRELFPAAA